MLISNPCHLAGRCEGTINAYLKYPFSGVLGQMALVGSEDKHFLSHTFPGDAGGMFSFCLLRY